MGLRGNYVAVDATAQLPNERYHVRILRQPRRVTVYVNDKQVLSERVRDIAAPYLRLVCFGSANAKVYYDNLKIRVPKMIEDDRQQTP